MLNEEGWETSKNKKKKNKKGLPPGALEVPPDTYPLDLSNSYDILSDNDEVIEDTPSSKRGISPQRESSRAKKHAA